MDSYQKLLNSKAQKKRDLIGKMFFPRTPVLLMDFSEEKHFSEYKELLDGLASMPLTVLIYAPLKLRPQLPYNKLFHYVTEQEIDSARAAADFELVFNGNVASAWRNGCVPIAKLNGDKTFNYNPLQEKGNGFYFKNPTKWEVFAAVIRALETYQFPYDWENLIREIIRLAAQ